VTRACDTAPTLLVLAKAPVPGRVKTRLCPPCSPTQAAAVAEAALADTLAAVVTTPGVRPRLVLDGAPGHWMPDGLAVTPQVRGDLATRIDAAFAATAGPAFLIGMDTPQVTPARLGAVIRALATPMVDAVLGLTADGGWWTVGFRRPTAGAFLGVPMSEPVTGSRQLRRLHELGLTTRLVDPLTDVDTFPDARAVARRMPGSRFAGVVDRVTAAGDRRIGAASGRVAA
jgi:glycosyltransferase A (GT-A) superfamily protein (DUF2064 family)